MFSFIHSHSMIIDEIIYGLCGLVSIITAFISLKGKKHLSGTFLFWGILGLLFMFGKVIVLNVPNGGAVIGGLLILLGVLTLTKQVKIADIPTAEKEEVEKNSQKVGNKIFIPAVLIGVVAMLLAQVKSFNISLGTNAAGKAIIFGFSTAQVVGAASIIALIFAVLLAKPTLKNTVNDTSKMLMQVGSSSLLPQLLGVLGAIFATAGIGKIIGRFASGIVPQGVPILGVIAYCLGMVIFTMIMGNAFAAFTVITIGVGVPFVIMQGGNPAVVGALGMTCGYCGTLLTPMAANFNIVPAAILETENKYTLIKTQAFMSVALIIVHIILMSIFAFVERIGINIDDCRIPDNEGNQPIDEPVIKGGPAAYFVTVPIKAIVENIQAHNIPASISNTAGTFICNHVCYGVAHLAAQRTAAGKPMKSGFIHIPFLPEQVIGKPALTPSMSLETIVSGITHALEAIVEHSFDIKVSGGKIC
nr:DUF979 family protein [Treponema sp. OMZ 305]